MNILRQSFFNFKILLIFNKYCIILDKRHLKIKNKYMDSTKSKKRHAWQWQEISKNYCKFIVPNRPSLGDCENYGQLIAKALRNKKNPKIMVMGSTPELRSILLQYEIFNKAEVYCVDLNYGMYQSMTDFMAHSAKFNEKHKKASWIDTKLPDKQFDLVVGDEVICNVDNKLHQELFKEINRVLKKDGVWITRNDVFLPENEKDDVRSILIDLAEKIDSGKYNLHFAINILYIKMFYRANEDYNPDNTMIGHYQIAKKEYVKSLKNHKYGKIISALMLMYKENFVALGGDYHWYVLSEKESEEELKPYFKLEKKVYSSDYCTAKNSPIYFLRKK